MSNGEWRELHDLFRRDVAPVERELAPGEGMLDARNLAHYFGVGQSALRCVKLALLASGRHPDAIRRILDLPCGHGRVLRTLRAAFPEAELVACDLLADGVEFCARAFGATPVPSSPGSDLPRVEGRFDLVWCGSLLTHLDAPRWTAFLSHFESLLAEGGLLLFTLHGRSVVERIRHGWDYGLADDALRELVQGARARGFGYVPYPGQHGYGISLATRPWVLRLLERFPALRLLYFCERGWDDHQDVVACVRESWTPVPGPAAQRLAGLDLDEPGA